MQELFEKNTDLGMKYSQRTTKTVNRDTSQAVNRDTSQDVTSHFSEESLRANIKTIRYGELREKKKE